MSLVVVTDGGGVSSGIGGERGATGGGSAVTTASLTDEPSTCEAKYFALHDPSQK